MSHAKCFPILREQLNPCGKVEEKRNQAELGSEYSFSLGSFVMGADRNPSWTESLIHLPSVMGRILKKIVSMRPTSLRIKDSFLFVFIHLSLYSGTARMPAT